MYESDSVVPDDTGVTDNNSTYPRPVIADCTDSLEVSPLAASDDGETPSNLADPLSSQLCDCKYNYYIELCHYNYLCSIK